MGAAILEMSVVIVFFLFCIFAIASICLAVWRFLERHPFIGEASAMKSEKRTEIVLTLAAGEATMLMAAVAYASRLIAEYDRNGCISAYPSEGLARSFVRPPQDQALGHLASLTRLAEALEGGK